jgi:ribosomal protein S18 acetylase RimI-like enzyme
MSSLRIQDADRDDIPVVQRLAEVTWRAHYPGIITPEQIDYMLARGYAREVLAGFLSRPGSGLALALRGGEPVGFAAWLQVDRDTSKLDKLYVLPQAQRTGAGRALIGHVADAARRDGATCLVLNVNKRNAGAITAYRRCGFSIREATVVDIGQGFVMDDYVMELSLRGSPARDAGAAGTGDLR